MIFNLFPSPERWDLVNKTYQNSLNCSLPLRSYSNPYIAVYDVLVGLSQLYSHKRSVAWLQGVSPVTQVFEGHFIREGYQLQKTSIQELLSNSSAIIDKLAKDTLWFFIPIDHAISGERFPLEFLASSLITKKIFPVFFSHEKIDLNNFSGAGTIISNFDNVVTFVRLADKLRVNPIVGYYQSEIKNLSFSTEKPLALDAILNWENQLGWPLWNYRGQRIDGRTTFFLPDIFPDLFLDRSGLCGVGFNSCSSKSLKTLSTWMSPELGDQDSRNLVTLDFSDSETLPDVKKLKGIAEQIKRESEWIF